MGKVKKTSLYLDLDSERGKAVDACIMKRDRFLYRTISDYLTAAVLAMEGADTAADAETKLAEKTADKVMERLYAGAGELARKMEKELHQDTIEMR